MSLIFRVMLCLLVATTVFGDGFKTKSKYKTKARYFRRIEQRQLDLIHHYFIVQSWRELEDPAYREKIHPGLFPLSSGPANTSVYPVLPHPLSDRYFGDNLDRLIESRRVGIP